jgi:hypothetical protein
MVDDQRDEIEKLRAEVAGLRGRRHALRLLGAAAVGGAAAVVAGGSAAAAGPLVIDAANSGAASTILTATASTAYAFGVFDINGLGAVPQELLNTAVIGHASNHSFVRGVGGYSTAPSGHGVVGQADGVGGVGVFGVASGDASAAVYGTNSAVDGIGVRGDATTRDATGVRGSGGVGVVGLGGDETSAPVISHPFEGLTSLLLPGGTGIAGLGFYGVYGVGTATGIAGFSAGVGGAFSGAPAINLSSSLDPPPTRTTRVGNAGSLDTDTTSSLWWCTTTGTPGTWQQLAGPGVAGAFHAITPTRVYDSRVAVPAPGTLAAGAHRTVSVADGRALTTGAATTKDLVPPGATAITCNVTVVDTVGAGFLTLNPGGITAVGAASVNWFATGQILNNGIVAALATDRTITLIAGGSDNATTNVVIDVTGWYR